MYENQALHLINQRLGDPEWRLHNATIAAVAALASYEMSNGTFDAAQAHLVGLEKMIRMKGGVDDPSISPGLRRIVLWVDLVATGHGIATPRITNHPSSSRALSDKRVQAGLGALPDGMVTVEELTDAVERDLGILTAAKTAKSFETATLDEDVVFGEKAYLVTKRLLDLTGTSMSLVPATCALDTFWAFAASLYSSIVLFETSIDSVIANTLVVKLRHCLEAVMERDGMASVSRAVKDDNRLFWALIIGGVASENTDQREWFVGTLRLFCQLLDPWSQKAMLVRRALMNGVLWHITLDELVTSLWDEVDDSNDTGSGYVWGSL